MATIKSYTDISQSKVLAKILPIESADMYYLAKPDDTNSNMVASDICIPRRSENDGQAFGEACAWSLAELLDVIPILNNRSPVLSKTFDRKYRVVYHSTAYEKGIYTEDFDNPVDACVAMIERLHELNLL